MVRLFLLAFVAFLALAPLATPIGQAEAATTCSFTVDGNTMTLNGNCSTDSTIVVPDGFTLDGAGYTITAVDPPSGRFKGAVVRNGGSVAHVKNVVITASGLGNTCQSASPPDNRLRGILLAGASGSVIGTTVTGINKGASGCQEGNAIEVRNAPFDGTHPATKAVTIKNNQIDRYQKTGIVANGDVNVQILNNQVGASATQANLAANSIQLGFGAMGSVMHNNVDGNQWLGASDYAATGMLIYAADSVNVSQNNIRGNSDVGIYIYGNDGVYDNNKVFDEGADGLHGDWGIGNWGDGNAVTNNKVRGFDIPYDGVTGGKNKVIPGPQSFHSD